MVRDFSGCRKRLYLSLASLGVALVLVCVMLYRQVWTSESFPVWLYALGGCLLVAMIFKLAAGWQAHCPRCRPPVLPFWGGLSRIRAILWYRPVVCVHCRETVSTDADD